MRHEQSATSSRGWIGWALLAVLAVASILIAASVAAHAAGLGSVELFGVVIGRIASGVVPALLWVGAGLGWGRLVMKRAAPSNANTDGAWALSAIAGNALLIWLAGAIGSLGLIDGATGMALAWLLVASGLLALLLGLRANGAGRLEPPNAPAAPFWLLAACAGPFIIACCTPPGTLWSSEARGYDTLSYHLALPQQWLADGRVHPLTSNVYSFLPSGMESAYALLGAMMGVGLGHGDIADGRWVLASQYVHALLGVLAAIGVAAAARRELERAGLTSGRNIAASAAGAFVLLIPWTLVTASEAYDEMGMLMCTAGLMIAWRQQGLSRPMRGAIIGGLLGAAVLCKATSLYMIAPGVIVAATICAFTCTDRRSVRTAWLLGAIAFVAVVSPWLIRNYAACGNPVFPFLTHLFGPAHWESDQVSRWNAEHTIIASLGERLGLLFSAGRGILHPQWSIGGAAVALAAIVALAMKPTHKSAAVVVLLAALQTAAWLFVGHLQSRFLMPIIVPGAMLLGLAIGALVTKKAPVFNAIGVVLSVLALGVPAFASWSLLVNESGVPSAIGLVDGVPGIVGEGRPLPKQGAAPSHLRESLENAGPPGAWNLIQRLATPSAGAPGNPPRLYLIGEGAALYYTPRGNVLWNTVWDAWPLVRAIRKAPGDPGAWKADLRATGITHVLINFSEIRRLRASGYSPPEASEENALKFTETLGEPLAAWPDVGVAIWSIR